MKFSTIVPTPLTKSQRNPNEQQSRNFYSSVNFPVVSSPLSEVQRQPIPEPFTLKPLFLGARTGAFSFPLPPSPHTNSARFPYQFGNDCTPIQHTVYANYPPTIHQLHTNYLRPHFQTSTNFTQNYYRITGNVLHFFPLSPPITSQFLSPFALVPRLIFFSIHS